MMGKGSAIVPKIQAKTLRKLGVELADLLALDASPTVGVMPDFSSWRDSGRVT